MTKEYFIKRIIEKWGMLKILQLMLLSSAAAGVTIVIGANLIPDDPEKIEFIEKENN